MTRGFDVNILSKFDNRVLVNDANGDFTKAFTKHQQYIFYASSGCCLFITFFVNLKEKKV